MTMSVIKSYSQIVKDRNTKNSGIVLGWETKKLRNSKNFDVIHWQGIVGQRSVDESDLSDLVPMIKLVSNKLIFSFVTSTSKKILAASRARLLPLRSRGCLVSPVLCILNVQKNDYRFSLYLIADKIVFFTTFSGSFISVSSSTLVANHCLASALQISK